MITREEIAAKLKPRPLDAHKGMFGHGLLVAGQYMMAGAAILAAKACMRSGIGKLTVMSPKENVQILQVCVPEAILRTSTTDICCFDALGIGCGLGTAVETQDLFIEIVKNAGCPVVIDADGINILGLHHDWLGRLPHGCILTPHKKELRGLIGNCADDNDELEKTLHLARKYDIFVVMKGHNSRIVCPDGTIHVNSTGNPGMATAGSGDVLTGVILSFLAQGYQPEDAAVMGTYIHGLAGDIAAEKVGEISLMAGDMIDALPKAFKLINN